MYVHTHIHICTHIHTYIISLKSTIFSMHKDSQHVVSWKNITYLVCQNSEGKDLLTLAFFGQKFNPLLEIQVNMARRCGVSFKYLNSWKYGYLQKAMSLFSLFWRKKSLIPVLESAVFILCFAVPDLGHYRQKLRGSSRHLTPDGESLLQASLPRRRHIRITWGTSAPVLMPTCLQRPIGSESVKPLTQYLLSVHYIQRLLCIPALGQRVVGIQI